MTNACELADHVAELIDQELWGQAAAEIASLEPADIAEFISHYNRDVIEALFKVLPESLKPDVLAELDPEIAAEITESMTSGEISDLFEEMEPDDAADVLGELDKAISSQVIEQMDEEEAEDVRRLMTYPETPRAASATTDLQMYGTQTVPRPRRHRRTRRRNPHHQICRGRGAPPRRHGHDLTSCG